MLPRRNLQSQAIYSELVEALSVAEIEGLQAREGSFARREINGRPYWYLRRRVGSRIQESYLGPETTELLARLDSLKKEATDAKAAARNRRSLIRMLRSAGYQPPARRVGRILEELAFAGVFRIGGVLVGTHAFQCYSSILGVPFAAELGLTSDLDFAQEIKGRSHHREVASPVFLEALGKAEEFLAIPDLDPRTPTTSWRSADHELRVDVLAPMVGPESEKPIRLTRLGTHATPLRFLDFLLEDTLRAAVMAGSGVLVRVPTPERFALHKLIVAQRRGSDSRDKIQKDLAQASLLLDILLEDHPQDLGDAWLELKARGKKWEGEVLKSSRLLKGDLWGRFLEVVEE